MEEIKKALINISNGVGTKEEKDLIESIPESLFSDLYEEMIEDERESFYDSQDMHLSDPENELDEKPLVVVSKDYNNNKSYIFARNKLAIDTFLKRKRKRVL